MEENSHHPRVALKHLDHLWFQVTGTLCNLACTHCFNSSGPGARTFDFLSRETIASELLQAVWLGVREVFFTGGEPFLHKQLIEFLRRSKGEYLVGQGLSLGGRLVEIFASGIGSWTVIWSSPAGISCLVASGEGWEQSKAVVASQQLWPLSGNVESPTSVTGFDTELQLAE